MFEKLFSPIKIKDMELKNRIILPAMGTKFSGDGSEVTDKLIDYHVARVKGRSYKCLHTSSTKTFLIP